MAATTAHTRRSLRATALTRLPVAAVAGWWFQDGMGPYQGPAPVPVGSIGGWMGWVLLIGLVLLLLLMLSRTQDRFRRPPGAR